jgi:two-component sensor histidine kinase
MKQWITKRKDTLFTMISLGLVLLFVGFSIFLIFQNRDDLLQQYYLKSKAQSQLFGENISALIQTADLMMLSVKTLVQASGIASNSLTPSTKDFIHSRTRFLQQIENVVFFDQNAHVTFSQKNYGGDIVPSFKNHREAWLEFAAGTIDLEKNHIAIYLSQRIEDDNGKFLGVLMTILKPEFFKMRFEQYLDVDVDSIVLIDQNSNILSFWTENGNPGKSFLHKTMKAMPGFTDLPQTILQGGGLQVSETDSLIVSSYQLPSLPYKILVSYKKDIILEEWRQRTLKNFGITLILATIAAITIIISIRQTQRRRAITQQLAEHKLNLEDIVRQRTAKLKTVNTQLEDEIAVRQEVEQQIKANLNEKETLLHEIHHRVKNNMNVITALLNLQMNKTDNKIAKAALQDSQNRVQSMSKIHETLYRSDNLAAIDLKTYLSELGGTIFQNYSISNKVQFKVEAENIMIGVKQASPVGLIVNELITNCLKYAFADDREGEILLELKSNKENGVELIVSDNGIGIPDSWDLNKVDSLGLKLVKMIAEDQLGGSVNIESSNGTKFTIKFNIDET